MTHELILQLMDEDFVDGCDIDHVLSIMEHHNSSKIMYFNIHLDEVSSDSPYLFAVYHADHGFLLTIRKKVEGKVIESVAGLSFENTQRIEFVAGEHALSVPRGLFLSRELAVSCVSQFCRDSSLFHGAQWKPHQDLGYELYAET